MKRRHFLQTGVAGALMAGVGPRPLLGDSGRISQAGGPIRLSSNENPLGLAPGARRAVIDGIQYGNRYPGDHRRPLIEALAAKHGVTSEHIVLGTGSTEVLQMAVQAFGRDGARFIIAEPTFEDVPGYAAPLNLRLEKVPLRADYAHDIEEMRRRSMSGGPSVIYFCNPNNPTATITPCREIDAWVEDAPEHVRFVMDEAYFEYAAHLPEYHDMIKWIDSKPNVVVARTFSKIYGMAGMRLGYALARPDTAAKLRSMQSRNNANVLALVAASASLEDADLVRRSLATNDRSREILIDVLDELELERLPSQANFMMHRIKGDVRTYIDRMREQGIAVGRPFPPKTDFNRVSLGSPEEMEQFAAVLRSFRERSWV